MTTAQEEFSRKFNEKASSPSHRGAYYQEDATDKGMGLVQVKYKDIPVG